MKKSIFVLLLTFSFSTEIFPLTAEEILKKVDSNLNFNTAIITTRLEIYLPNQPVRIKKLKSYIKGKNAYTEFLNREDQHTRYLKLNKQMWVYDKEEENTFLISGHMLKQGMMSSDISYEDALESEQLYNLYNIELLSEENLNERQCYVVLLTAKSKNVSYFKRKMWIDKEYFVPLKEERYAVSGKILKVFEYMDIQFYKGRAYPTKSIVSDKLKKDTKTIAIIEEAGFDIPIPDTYFTRRYLER